MRAWTVAGIHPAVPEPPHTSEPGSRRPHRCRPRRERRPSAPPVKERRRGSRIASARAADVLEPVLQTVDERVAHLARCAQPVRVIAIRPHASVPPEDAVDGLGHAHRESLASAGETAGAVGFDEQMNVIGLNAEVQQAEVCVRGGGKRAADRFEHASASK